MEPNSLVKWLKDNAVGIINLLLSSGSGLIAFMIGAKEMIVFYPLQSFLLMFSAFALGFFVFHIVVTKTRHAKDKRTLQTIKGLPPQLIDAIHHAYKNGTYVANCYDSTVQYLLELGFLGSPSTVSTLYETQFILQPWFKSFLDRHHDQVFGSQSR